MMSNTATQVEGVVFPIATAGPLTSIGGQPLYPPNPEPPQEIMRHAIQFMNINPVTNFLGNMNVRVLSNPLVWPGMKSIRDLDIHNVLKENWNTRLQLAAWSPHKPLSDLENDMFIRSLTEFPWGSTGNVAFFCNEKKVLRCHGILLQCILPEFYRGLIDMANFQYSPSFWSPELPYIPIYVPGANLRCIENLVSLIFRGEAVVTGEEVYQLLRVIELLKIHELEVCIDTTGKSCNTKALTTSAATVAQPTASNSRAVSIASAPFYGRFQEVIKNIEADKKKLRKRTFYSKDLREKVLDALNKGKKVRDVGRALNLPSKVISRWRYEAKRAAAKPINVKWPTTVVSLVYNQESLTVEDNQNNGEHVNVPEIPVVIQETLTMEVNQNEGEPVSVPEIPVVIQETLTMEVNQNEGEPVSVPEIPVDSQENVSLENNQDEGESGQ